MEDQKTGPNHKKRKLQRKGSDGGNSEKRFKWPPELHIAFVECLFELGMKAASPKVLLELMPETPGLTGEHIKSHLQKYRLMKDRSKKEFVEHFTMNSDEESRIDDNIEGSPPPVTVKERQSKRGMSPTSHAESEGPPSARRKVSQVEQANSGEINANAQQAYLLLQQANILHEGIVVEEAFLSQLSQIMQRHLKVQLSTLQDLDTRESANNSASSRPDSPEPQQVARVSPTAAHAIEHHARGFEPSVVPPQDTFSWLTDDDSKWCESSGASVHNNHQPMPPPTLNMNGVPYIACGSHAGSLAAGGHLSRPDLCNGVHHSQQRSILDPSLGLLARPRRGRSDTLDSHDRDAVLDTNSFGKDFCDDFSWVQERSKA